MSYRHLLKHLIRSNEDSGDNSSTTLEANGQIFKSVFVPEEVICYILSLVEPHSLVFSCRRVCRLWRKCIDNGVWKVKLRNVGGKKLSSISQLSATNVISLHLPWYVYYAIFNTDPFEKNLLKNNCGRDGLAYWSVTQPKSKYSEKHWGLEYIPSGSFPLPNSEDFGNNTCCFVTSYYLCAKNQLIDLKEEGIFLHLLNELQPTITVSEWYAGRIDCGCRYVLKASLLDEKMGVICEKKEERKVLQWSCNQWHKVTMVFENYGPGVRYVLFHHEGKDTQYWAGYYGSKMSGGVVKVSLPRNLEMNSSLSDSEDARNVV